MREIALIQTFNYASIVQYDLYLPNSNVNEKSHFKWFNLKFPFYDGLITFDVDLPMMLSSSS